MSLTGQFNDIQKEEVYKLICVMAEQYPNISKEILIQLWCNEQNMDKSIFDDLIGLSYVPCPSCQKLQLVDDPWNFHCQYCPHYTGPAQCVYHCCLGYTGHI
jgi:hypothetical protein